MGAERRASQAEEELFALRRRVGELEQAIQGRDDFIAIMSHELRNPLTPVLLQAELLLKEIRDADPLAIRKERVMAKLTSFVRRLSRFLQTLDQLVEAARLGSQPIAISPSSIDLADVVRDVCSAMDHDFDFGQSQLRLVADRPILGRWDRLRIEQIVRNLLSNAIRYGAGKPIDVVVEEHPPDAARITVRDSGPGIAPADQERIFRKYDRAAMQAHSGGFGLGLWLVRSLCTSMGGRIDVHSELGRGATFVVTLPHQGKA